MKTIFLSLIYVTSIFSQGMYLSKENALSLGVMYGRYDDDNKLSLAASYSLSGSIDFNYIRSSIVNDESISNYQNEYFIRAYILKEKSPVFLSGAFGYIYQKAETELWNNYPLTDIQKGFTYQMGLHFSAIKNMESPKIVASIIYKHFNSEEEIRTLAGTMSDEEIIRSIMFEAALIYYFSQVGIVIAPRMVMDNNLDDHFYGLNLTFMLRH